MDYKLRQRLEGGVLSSDDVLDCEFALKGFDLLPLPSQHGLQLFIGGAGKQISLVLVLPAGFERVLGFFDLELKLIDLLFKLRNVLILVLALDLEDVLHPFEVAVCVVLMLLQLVAQRCNLLLRLVSGLLHLQVG
jgi:hypothetical protein